MGTRSLTIIKDGGKSGKEIAVLYRQYDGSPDGHGKELADFLAGKRMVNGISANPKTVINGPNALAAQVVAFFTDPQETGGFYLYPAGTRDCGEEYIYTLTAQADKPINLKVEAGFSNKVLFNDTPEEFLVALESGKLGDA